jgi:hypothetical protein
MLLAFSYLGNVRAQQPEEALESFLDTSALGVRIQVNATAQARPGDNVTVMLVLTTQTVDPPTEVDVENLSLSILGFLNGTYGTPLGSPIQDGNFTLSTTPRSYNSTFTVPAWVTGKIYGEIKLAHTAYWGPLGVNTTKLGGLVWGFYMTDVENVYLEELQQNYQQLNQTYTQLNYSYTKLNYNFTQLNYNYAQLQKNLTDALQGNSNSLDSARTVITVLMITTIFFIATTLYFVIKKPKEPW